MKRHAKSPRASHSHSEEFKRSVVAQLINKKPAELAAEHKVHVSRIYAWKEKYASTPPPTNGSAATATPAAERKRNANSGLTVEQKRAAVAELNAKAATAKQIAQRLGVSDASVYAWRKKFSQNGGGELVPVNGAAQKVTVFRAAAKNGTKALSVADESIAVHDARLFLNRAVQELDDMRPRDLGTFHLSVLFARNSLLGK